MAGAAAVVAVLVAAGLAAPAVAGTPLPRPRPGAAPPAAPPASDAAAEAVPSAPSACRLALTEAIAQAPSVAAISGPGECGGDDLVRLEAVVLADRRRVALKPAATLRCEMAAAVAAWLREDVAALVERDGARLTAVEVADAFSCRGRNRVPGARLSEHGLANAIDIRALRLAGAAPLTLPDAATPRDLRLQLRTGLCARFTTVLGPGSDGYHEDHIHLDLRRRSSGYRICQWTIEDEKTAAAAPVPATTDAGRPPESAPAPSAPASGTATGTPVAVAAVPLPRPRPAAAPQRVRAEAPARPAAERSPRKRRAARRPPPTPWPFSLLR